MEIDSLKKRFEIWKHILFINIGAALTLLATSIADLPNPARLDVPGWYGIWFVVQLASFLPGFVLLWGKHWLKIPLYERLDTIFGYFVVAWLTLLAIGLRIGSTMSDPFGAFLLGCAAAIAIGYWWSRRKSLGSQNEMFP